MAHSMVPSRDVPRPPNQPEKPDFQKLLYVLQDDHCRTIYRHLTEPMTANEIAAATDTSLSTAFRKLDRLCDASLLKQITDIRAKGQHITKYQLRFETVQVLIDLDEQDVDMSVSPPASASYG